MRVGQCKPGNHGYAISRKKKAVSNKSVFVCVFFSFFVPPLAFAAGASQPGWLHRLPYSS